ncbi:MAG: starch-binding protein [Flavobacteriales bacterium]|nr:starch-binding protein [Flavobacteriales bacterium]
MNNIRLLLTLSLCFIYTLFLKSQDTNVLLQGFNWESWNKGGWYNQLNGKVNDFSNAGITGIWLPPMSTSTGGAGYIPKGWYNLNSNYGNEGELKSLISNMHSKGIIAIADIVINHRGGEWSSNDFATPSWNTPGEQWSIVSDDGGSGSSDYDAVGAGLKNPGDLGNFGGYGTKDLDHTNKAVRSETINWLNWLKSDIGFDAWRFDFAHGYDPKYNKEYIASTNPTFAVSELLEGSRERLEKWLDLQKDGGTPNSTLFDFATKRYLHEAFQENNLTKLVDSNGKAAGLIGTYPQFSTTVLDNHDTGPYPNQEHWAFPSKYVVNGYAYILTHPGVPMVFWDHMYEWGNATSDPIKQLIAIRKRNEIHSTSSLQIVEARQNLYASITDDRVALKLGSDSWTPGSGWTEVASGTDWKVWEKDGSAVVRPELTISPAGGTYIGGVQVTLSATGNNTPIKIHYTLDGTAPSSASPFVNSGGTVQIPATNTTLKAVAIDNNNVSSYVSTEQYQTEESTGIQIGFNNTNNWDKVYIYAWQEGNPNILGSWPGTLMSKVNAEWFKYTFDESISTVNIVINNDSGSQTEDILSITQSTCYDSASNIIDCENLSAENIEISSSKVELYPNPASNYVYFTSEETLISASIYNLEGKLVRNVINIKDNSIDISGITSGNYIIVFTDDNHTKYSERIIIK